jgi:hypothetical protein
MFVAYAVSYAVTYIATGSAKAAQSAGLSAVLFMGIGGLREGKMGANGKMQYNPEKIPIWIGVFQRIVYCIAVSVVTLCVEYMDQY